MKPLRVWAKNLRSYESFDLAIPDGISAIVGANGAGKSTILLALEAALFPSRGGLARMLRRGGGEETVEVGVEFEHRGELYRARRTGGAKPTFDFERQTSYRANGATEIWNYEVLGRESIAETAALVEETIGLSRSTFRASALLMQGDGAAFAEAAPAERKRILADALGLDVYQRLADAATIERRFSETRLSAVGARLAEIGRELDRKEEVEETLATRRRVLEEARESETALLEGARLAREQHAEALERSSAFRDAERAVREAYSRHRDAEDELKDVRAMIVGVEEAISRRDQTAKVAATVPMLEQAERVRDRVTTLDLETDRFAKEATRARGVGVEAGRRLAAVADQVARLQAILDSPAAVCDACGQSLAGAALARYVDGVKVRLAAVEEDAATEASAVGRAADDLRSCEERAAETRKELAEAMEEFAVTYTRAGLLEGDLVGDRLARAREAERDLAVLDEKARTLDDLKERAHQLAGEAAGRRMLLKAAEETLAEMEEPNVAEASNEVERATATVRNTQLSVQNLARGLGEAEAEARRLEELERREGELGAERATLEQDLAVVRTLERAYGRDGIPALLLENRAIPQIEAEATRIVAALGFPVRFELRTQRAKKGGGVADALDVAVVAADGEALYEDFSGGERTRMDLALRIALARLLARSRAAEVGLLAIDEPSFLDAAGFERLASVLRELGDEFPKILVVSHDPALRDAFDQAIVVSGGGGEPSRIEALS